jgi:8-oxo-dGTP pyrophosphatase MutT (NUDIX family)
MPINTEPDIHKLVVCANVFVKKDGKYLLLERSPKKRFAPDVTHPIGGKVDLGENPFVAAEREVLEEAGIKVKNMRLEAVLLEVFPKNETPYNWLIFHFSADWASGEVKQTEEGKFILLEKDQIAKQKLFPSVQQVIENILNPNDGCVFATFKYNERGEIIEADKNINKCVIY